MDASSSNNRRDGASRGGAPPPAAATAPAPFPPVWPPVMQSLPPYNPYYPYTNAFAYGGYQQFPSASQPMYNNYSTGMNHNTMNGFATPFHNTMNRFGTSFAPLFPNGPPAFMGTTAPATNLPTAGAPGVAAPAAATTQAIPTTNVPPAPMATAAAATMQPVSRTSAPILQTPVPPPAAAATNQAVEGVNQQGADSALLNCKETNKPESKKAKGEGTGNLEGDSALFNNKSTAPVAPAPAPALSSRAGTPPCNDNAAATPTASSNQMQKDHTSSRKTTKRKLQESEEDKAPKPKRNREEEAAPQSTKGEPKQETAENVLKKYLQSPRDQLGRRSSQMGRRPSQKEDQSLVPRVEPSARDEFELVPNMYGKDGIIDGAFSMSRDYPVSYVFRHFLQEVGWLATHRMLTPFTSFGIIDEDNIRKCLDTVMHPKHWSFDRCMHPALLPGWPVPYEPRTVVEKAMYYGKNKGPPGKEAFAAYQEARKERQRIADSGQEDPDQLIHEAADFGTYINQLCRDSPIHVSGFSGEVVASRRGYDSKKDEEERRDLYAYLRLVCRNGSRALFDKMTDSDKIQIDACLGPGYSDLPALLETSLTSTGAQEFDKEFPQPPAQYRLDVCEMIPYIHDNLMYERVIWSDSENVLTPGAAVILTAAVSAVLYKAHQHKLAKEKLKEKWEREDREDSDYTHKSGSEEEEGDAIDYESEEDVGVGHLEDDAALPNSKESASEGQGLAQAPSAETEAESEGEDEEGADQLGGDSEVESDEEGAGHPVGDAALANKKSISEERGLAHATSGETKPEDEKEGGLGHLGAESASTYDKSVSAALAEAASGETKPESKEEEGADHPRDGSEPQNNNETHTSESKEEEEEGMVHIGVDLEVPNSTEIQEPDRKGEENEGIGHLEVDPALPNKMETHKSESREEKLEANEQGLEPASSRELEPVVAENVSTPSKAASSYSCIIS